MNPYIYPKTRHARTQTPKAYVRYQSFKASLQIEFKRKCVYCMQPDSSTPRQDGFGVDHYRPKKYFPKLATAYDNLFYCCAACNSYKGSYWPAKGKEDEFIPNPCDHEMFRHLRFNGAEIESKSAAGKKTLALLDLNAPKVVEFRKLAIATIGSISYQLKDFETTQAQILTHIERGDFQKNNEVQTQLTELGAHIETLNRALQLWTGALPI